MGKSGGAKAKAWVKINAREENLIRASSLVGLSRPFSSFLSFLRREISTAQPSSPSII